MNFEHIFPYVKESLLHLYMKEREKERRLLVVSGAAMSSVLLQSELDIQCNSW